MPKRPANDTLPNGQPYSKAPVSGARREAAVEDEMGEFEDAWEDEVESDEEVIDGNEEDKEDGTK